MSDSHVEKPKPPVTPEPPKQLTPSELKAREHRERLRAGKAGPKEILSEEKTAAEAESDTADRNTIEERLSGGVDVLEGTEFSSLNKDRLQQALDSQKLKSDFLNKDFKTLEPWQQNVIVNQVTSGIWQINGGKEMIVDEVVVSGKELNDKEFDAAFRGVAENILIQPDFRDAVRTTWKDTIKADFPEVSVEEAQAKMDADLRSLDQGIMDIDNKIKIVDSASREFQSEVEEVSDAGELIRRPGKKWKAMIDAQKVIEQSKEDHSAITQELEAKMQERVGQPDAVVDTINAEIISLKEELGESPYPQAQREYDTLMNEENGLRERKETLVNASFQIKSDKGILEGTEVSDVQRVISEVRYIEQLGSVFENAVNTWTTVTTAEESISTDEKIKKDAEDVLDPMTKSLMKSIASRWGEVAYKDGKLDVSGLDRGKIKQDVADLFMDDPRKIALGIVNEEGRFYNEYDLQRMSEDRIGQFKDRTPELVMTKMLQSTLNPETDLPWTLTDIADKKRADPDFFDNQQNDMVISLMRKGALSGEVKYTTDVQKKISEAKWANDALNSVFEDETFKDELGKLNKAEYDRKHPIKGEHDDEHGDGHEKHEDKRADSFEKYALKKAASLVKNKYFWAYMGMGLAGLALVMYNDYKKEKIKVVKQKGSENGVPDAHPPEEKEKNKKKTEEDIIPIPDDKEAKTAKELDEEEADMAEKAKKAASEAERAQMLSSEDLTDELPEDVIRENAERIVPEPEEPGEAV